MKHVIEYEGDTIQWDDEAGVVSVVPGKETDTGLISWLNARFADAPVTIVAPSCPPIRLQNPAHDPRDFLGLLSCACPWWERVKLPPSLENVKPTPGEWKEGPINPKTLPGMVY